RGVPRVSRGTRAVGSMRAMSGPSSSSGAISGPPCLQSELHAGALLLERRRLDPVLAAPASIHRLEQLHLTEVEQTRGHAVLGREGTSEPEVLVGERQVEARGAGAAEERGQQPPAARHSSGPPASSAYRL